MSKVLIDLVGKKFGRLTVIRREGFKQCSTKQPTWACQCDCGGSKVVLGVHLRGGTVRSCGCLHLERAKKLNRSHGGSGTATHTSWRAMRERCTNPSNSHYKNYGGRGIGFTAKWNKFENFLLDMGERPEGTSLERRDNNGDYEPENCFWATPNQQSRNTTRTIKIEWQGRTQCMKDWAKEIGVTDCALKYRIKKFGLQTAMTMPKYSKSNKKVPHESNDRQP